MSKSLKKGFLELLDRDLNKMFSQLNTRPSRAERKSIWFPKAAEVAVKPKIG